MSNTKQPTIALAKKTEKKEQVVKLDQAKKITIVGGMPGVKYLQFGNYFSANESFVRKAE